MCAHVCACLAGRKLWAQAVGEHSWLHTAIHQSVTPLTAANKYTATGPPNPPPSPTPPSTRLQPPSPHTLPLTPLLRSTSPAQNCKPHLLIAAFTINLAPVTWLVNRKNELNMWWQENMFSVYWKYPVNYKSAFIFVFSIANSMLHTFISFLFFLW